MDLVPCVVESAYRSDSENIVGVFRVAEHDSNIAVRALVHADLSLLLPKIAGIRPSTWVSGGFVSRLDEIVLQSAAVGYISPI